jgi:hypothetical protein
MKYDFISDPGHGWLKVKRSELRILGIDQQITPFSYQRGEYVYLEEDGDAALFVKTKRKRNQTVRFRERNAAYRASRIRNYECYRP